MPKRFNRVGSLINKIIMKNIISFFVIGLLAIFTTGCTQNEEQAVQEVSQTRININLSDETMCNFSNQVTNLFAVTRANNIAPTEEQINAVLEPLVPVGQDIVSQVKSAATRGEIDLSDENLQAMDDMTDSQLALSAFYLYQMQTVAAIDNKDLVPVGPTIGQHEVVYYVSNEDMELCFNAIDWTNVAGGAFGIGTGLIQAMGACAAAGQVALVVVTGVLVGIASIYFGTYGIVQVINGYIDCLNTHAKPQGPTGKPVPDGTPGQPVA